MLWILTALLGLALPALAARAAPVSSTDEAAGAALSKLFDGTAGAGSADFSPTTGLPAPAPVKGKAIPKDDGALLEDLSQRSFRYFWDTADPKTGLFPDRAPGDCSKPQGKVVASVAASGFGLTGYCLAAERGWVPRKEALERTRRALTFLAKESPQKNGWFYHFVDAANGQREWSSEVSSIDTALMLGGVLTARQYFADDPEIASLASEIYDRVDFPWMLDKKRNQFSHGWTPEGGFIKTTWDTYSEESLLLILALGSRTHPVDAGVWDAISRPEVSYSSHDYVSGAAPPFIHQFSQAWVDFRGLKDRHGIDYFANSAEAMRAHRQFCMDLAKEFPDYGPDMWGISASDSQHGYQAWGGPPRSGPIDGTVVPYVAGGALMFTPDIAVPALRAMREKS
ncbi:MAG: hypothetical protein NTY77_01440, partial [Elusimicrobia bacterium]|nr:hypothetical protein [Elusimicrobiota bacterium]